VFLPLSTVLYVTPDVAGRAWVAFGSQFTLHLFEVDVERGFMIDLDITVSSSE
jgi:hypothetical protein